VVVVGASGRPLEAQSIPYALQGMRGIVLWGNTSCDNFFFLLNPWYDFRYMTSTPQGPTTAFGKNPIANKNPKQNITNEIKLQTKPKIPNGIKSM